MSLLQSVHHIATATNDLDRMMAFYAEAFELEPKPGFPMETPVGRIAFYDIGGVEWQVAESATEITAAPADIPAVLLQQGLRVDHVTFHIADPETFATVKGNLVRLGASTGDVQDFRGSDLLAFTDPDGHTAEVIHTPGG